jgi:hypothetical protein
MAVVILAAAVTVLVFVPMRRAIRSAKTTGCVGNLSQLWKMQPNYMVRYGGEARAMPVETGSDFWLKLTRTSPPLIDATIRDVFFCPVRAWQDRPADYRGPASDVNRLGDGDPVGADIDGNHGRGEGGNVLRKSGDVQTVWPDDAQWLRAGVTTRP